MWPAAFPFLTMHSHSFKLILAAASVKVEGESKTLRLIQKQYVPLKADIYHGKLQLWAAFSSAATLKESQQSRETEKKPSASEKNILKNSETIRTTHYNNLKKAEIIISWLWVIIALLVLNNLVGSKSQVIFRHINTVT